MVTISDILESLRPYAQAPGRVAPPEILPWDSSAAWALDGAARKALGLLLAGEGPGKRLHEIADYMLAFCIVADRSHSFPDALLLNGAALALYGYICDGHPEAHIWRITGAARLATEMHARKVALENRIGADCLLAVCQQADETGLPILADLITLRERMWGRLLDHTHAEMLHVPAAAYPSYMKNPAAVEQVGDLMRKRSWQQQARAPEYMLHADIAQAEQTINNLLTLHNHMLVRYHFGSELDWYLRLLDDKESTVSLNTQHCIASPSASASHTPTNMRRAVLAITMIRSHMLETSSSRRIIRRCGRWRGTAIRLLGRCCPRYATGSQRYSKSVCARRGGGVGWDGRRSCERCGIRAGATSASSACTAWPSFQRGHGASTRALAPVS